MQTYAPLANLTLKHKIIAIAIGAFSALALVLGMGAPAGASSGYGSYGGVDLNAVSVDATSFSEHTTYSAKSLIVVYEEVNYTNSVEFSEFSLNTLDLSKDGYGNKHYGDYDKKDYGKHDW